MEARDGATGDGHEQQRYQRRRTGRYIHVEHGCNHHRIQDHNGAVQNQQADKQLQAVDIVAWLQQHPHRQYRSNGSIEEQQKDPGRVTGDARYHFGRHLNRHGGSHEDQGVERYHTENRDHWQRHDAAIDQLADDQRNNDRTPDRHYRCREGHHQARNHHRENGVDHQQHQEDNDHEDAACTLANHVAGQRADRFGLVAHAGPDRAGVMNTREEHGTQHNPGEGRRPTPDYCNGWPNNGCRAGYGSEMVTPEDELVSRYKIHTIFKFMCGCQNIWS